MTTLIDVGETIERQRLGRYQFWTFGLCAAFLFFDGFDAIGTAPRFARAGPGRRLPISLGEAPAPSCGAAAKRRKLTSYGEADFRPGATGISEG